MNEVFDMLAAAHSEHARRRRWLVWVFALLVVASFGSCCVFIVGQGRVGVRPQSQADTSLPLIEAGLHIKWPWQSVERIDRRIRATELPPREKQIADGEPVIVHPYVVWRVEPGQAALFIGAGGSTAVKEHMIEMIWRDIDIELSGMRMIDLLIGHASPDNVDRPLTQLADRVRARCQPRALRQFGVQLLEVRIVKLACPEEVMPQVLDRMIAQRHRRTERIRANAQKQVARIELEAQSRADQLMVEADERVREIEAAGESAVLALIREAGFQPAYEELLIQVEQYWRLLEENASVVISEGRLFDTLWSADEKPAAARSKRRPVKGLSVPPRPPADN
jgi:membrane protease subunit HflC